MAGGLLVIACLAAALSAVEAEGNRLDPHRLPSDDELKGGRGREGPEPEPPVTAVALVAAGGLGARLALS
jgi:hypothetical protein